MSERTIFMVSLAARRQIAPMGTKASSEKIIFSLAARRQIAPMGTNSLYLMAMFYA